MGKSSGGTNSEDDEGYDSDKPKWKDVFDVSHDTRVPDSVLTLLEQLTILSIQDTEVIPLIVSLRAVTVYTALSQMAVYFLPVLNVGPF